MFQTDGESWENQLCVKQIILLVAQSVSIASTETSTRLIFNLLTTRLSYIYSLVLCSEVHKSSSLSSYPHVHHFIHKSSIISTSQALFLLLSSIIFTSLTVWLHISRSTVHTTFYPQVQHYIHKSRLISTGPALWNKFGIISKNLTSELQV